MDPHSNNILFFGARSGHGLWKSTNFGATWTQVTSLPDPGPLYLVFFFQAFRRLTATQNRHVRSRPYGLQRNQQRQDRSDVCYLRLNLRLCRRSNSANFCWRGVCRLKQPVRLQRRWCHLYVVVISDSDLLLSTLARGCDPGNEQQLDSPQGCPVPERRGSLFVDFGWRW